jgi:hypothetical protein
LVPALPATAYLGIPAGAEFIKALMPGILSAIWAKAAESLGYVAKKNFAAPGEVRLCRPNSKRRKHPLPEVETYAASTTPSLVRRIKANSTENIAEGEGQGGTGDHRILLRGADTGASSMPVHQACQPNVRGSLEAKSGR